MYQGRLRSHKRTRELDEKGGQPSVRLKRKRVENDRSSALAHISKWLQQRLHLVARNKVDPITLEAPEAPVFKHVSEDGFVTAFDARNLAEYFRATGNFIHPTTRVPLNDVELRRLDKVLGGSAGPPLMPHRRELEERRGRSMQQMMEVRRLETTLQLTLDDMLQASRLRANPRVALSHIILVHFPAYHAVMMQLLALNHPVEALLATVAGQCLTVVEAAERCHLELVSLILTELDAVCQTLQAIPIRP
jgi:hypothetical protein